MSSHNLVPQNSPYHLVSLRPRSHQSMCLKDLEVSINVR